MGFARTARRSLYWSRAIFHHPANQGARVAAVRRAAEWHWRARGGNEIEALVVVDSLTQMIVRPNQFGSVWTLYDGIHEWEELQFCLRFLRPIDHFVDVGANVGAFSTLIGTRLPGVQITAIEPFTPVRVDLERNLALNDLVVELVVAAAGAKPGQAPFEILGRDALNRLAPEESDASETSSFQVSVRTLDEILGTTVPTLIKIDVEGAELSVLRGALQTMAAHSPVILFEHCGHGAAYGVTPADIRSFLSEMGYGIFLLDGQLTPWESDDLPPTPNVVAAKDIQVVRDRMNAPGGAPAAAPVHVRVTYRSPNEPTVVDNPLVR